DRTMIDRRAHLAQADPAIYALIQREVERQEHGLELIASENFATMAVMEAMGTALTNKYAEGLPKKRYYGGCEVVDEVEQLAIDRAKALFKAAHGNVQPRSGAQANMAAQLAEAAPARSGPSSWSIWRPSPVSWRRAFTRRRCRTRRSSPPRRTRRCAVRAAA